MENRTKTIKTIAESLKTLNPDENPEIKEKISTLTTLIDAFNKFSEPISQLKGFVPKNLQELNFVNDEQCQRELNCSKAEIDELLSGKDGEDFDKFLALILAIYKCQFKKAGFFSPDKKNLGLAVKAMEGMIEQKDQLFDAIINKLMPAVSSQLNVLKLRNGDISGLTGIANVPILLKGDEKCFVDVDGVELYEDRAVSDIAGGYDGFSFRIAKGVSYRIGGFKASSESHMEKRLIDKGRFYVTNKRYIFDGSSKNIEGMVDNIISVEAYSDGIKISRANKRDEVFVGDSDWGYVGAIISGIVKSNK